MILKDHLIPLPNPLKFCKKLNNMKLGLAYKLMTQRYLNMKLCFAYMVTFARK